MHAVRLFVENTEFLSRKCSFLKISLKVLVLEQNVALELIETWPFRTI
jgi:hypothetical protein